ncbi:MAG: hypothetical protein QG604_846 [Candidatus Dependentiae bacterium]|nr:hypothetical protein [Candidatus Dependentiae bacterium]
MAKTTILTLRTICMSVRNARISAFSLIEIMIGLAIIGIGASMVMPRLLRRSPTIEWPALNQELNNILYFARQEAITTQKVHRLTFNKKKRSITVEAREGDTEKGVPKYVSVYSTYFTAEYEFPEQITLEWVKLGKKDLFDEHKGIAWCYVVPNGLVQDVSVKLVRDDRGAISSKVFNAAPFLGTFAEEEKL